MQFAVYSEEAIVPVRETATVAMSLADMGLAGPVRVRDLWTHTDLGVFEKTFAREIRFHGAGLYRLSPESAARR